MMGGGASLPADVLSLKEPEIWTIKPEEKDLLGRVSTLYMRNRFNIALEGPRLFDFAFFGVLLSVYGPRILKHVVKIRKEAMERAAQHVDDDPRGSGVRQIDPSGEHAPSGDAPPVDPGPDGGTPPPGGLADLIP